MKQLKQNHNHRLSRWLFFNKKNKSLRNQGLIRARDGVRTRDPDLGKVVLYQLSHSRIRAGDGNRTHVFSLEG